MTNQERLRSMRPRDLVALCEKWGVKVKATRGLLKEARGPVEERLIAAGWPDGRTESDEETVDTTTTPSQEEDNEVTDTEQDVNNDDNPMSEEERDLIDALKDFTEIYPDITVEEIGYRSFEMRKGDGYIGIITPCRDTVIIAFTTVESIGYDKIVDKLEELVR